MRPGPEDEGAVGTGRTLDPARAIARTVLYEGYVLWPYRRSAPKNQRRWTFGGVHPRAWSEAGHDDDAWRMRTECLVALPADRDPPASDDAPTIRVAVRFLQVVERRVARLAGEALEFVDEIEVGGDRWVAWDEAREREVGLPPLPLEDGAETRTSIDVPPTTEHEWLEGADGERVAAIVRSWRGLSGELLVRCRRATDDVVRVEAEVSNTTGWSGGDREDALRSTFASTHLVLHATRAELISLTDPPARLAEAAESCRNEGCWPVLVGRRGATDTVLASPIILPDYPAIAPESPGDLFDGGEIDELLTLHVMALSDAEKEEMRATDPRTREILNRTTALAPERLRELHGTFRDARTGDPSAAATGPTGATPGSGEDARPDIGGNLAREAPDPFWVELGEPPAQEIVVDGVALRRGSRVRLRPRPGGDVMDIALAGRTAVVEGIDEDASGGVHFAVAVEDDPGVDLGMGRFPGHRFFFRPEEIEPIREHRILVAGVGNIFLGDDGFGVEVARRLSERSFPDDVTVKDFGIRGVDLAYAMEDYDTVVFVDAVPRGREPGTVYVVEASPEDDGPVAVQTHGVDPVKVLAFARALGPLPERVYVVGCEPAVIPDPDSDEFVGELSPPVRAAIDVAVGQVESLLSELRARADERTGAAGPEAEQNGGEKCRCGSGS